MSGERDLGSHVEDMIESCERIIMFVQSVHDAELRDTQRPLWGAVLHHLMILGEASKQVPEEWKARYADIPWRRIAGVRDKIVHYYFGINDDIVVWAVRTSVPAILPRLRAMLAEMDSEED